MQKLDTKKQKQTPQTSSKSNTTNVSGAHSDIIQMASKMGNSAMLGLLNSQPANPETQNTKSEEGGGEKLPPSLQERMEEKLKMQFGDVRVHYNSDRPAEFGARAFTKGNQIYIAQGQEDTLEHELGHVVQQKQGRVHATGNIRGKLINEDESLENHSMSMFGNVNQANEEVIQFQQTEIYFKGNVIYTDDDGISHTVETNGNHIYLTTTKSHPKGKMNFIVQYRDKILKDMGVPKKFWGKAVIDDDTYGRKK